MEVLLDGREAQDVELAPAPQAPLCPLEAGGPRIQVVQQHWRERLLVVGLVVALAVPGVTIAAVVTGEWVNRPEQRGWLIIGFGFYIAAAMRALWEIFLRLYERTSFLRVELRRYTSPTLYESVTDTLAKESEKRGLTCSWDQEATQEHDRVTGDTSVKLRFWASRARAMDVCIRVPREEPSSGPPEELQVHFQYSPGEDVILGRDSRLERREVLVLSIRTSPERALHDKALLTRWLQLCYTTFVQPIDGVVSVFALQESSTDWVPEWKFERSKPCKSASGTGQSFFLHRGSLDTVLADARLWASTSLRVYMVTGPPGVGKSEFTIWLAGQLRLPVYRLCLTSKKLTDDRLAQLLSQSAVGHNSVLVQVDEFQGTVERWVAGVAAGGAAGGVTPGGFCECLQGSTAMGKGVVVLSGTSELMAEEVRKRLPAVYRRIHCVAELSWMAEEDVRCYFRQFLLKFVPGQGPDAWAEWEQAFMREGSPWKGQRPITVDMLKQYLMRQITESSVLGYGDFSRPPGASSMEPEEFQVRSECCGDFFTLVCDPERAAGFLDSYAPVQVTCVGPPPQAKQADPPPAPAQAPQAWRRGQAWAHSQPQEQHREQRGGQTAPPPASPEKAGFSGLQQAAWAPTSEP